MKKILFLLIAMLMSFSTSTFAGTTTSASSVENAFKVEIPTNLTIKQTVTFNDGSTIYLYYQKEGNVCKLYSNTDVTKYKESDLDRIKSTSFEITDHVEGKCLITRKASDILKFAKSILGKIQ